MDTVPSLSFFRLSNLQYRKIDEEKIEVELIKPNSEKYHLACQLRYKLFFAKHDLPWEVVDDRSEADVSHAAISIENRLVAYAQLVRHSDRIYQICQMVVEPDYQKQNLGRKILSTLIEIARQEGAIALTLNARLTAVGFYQKLGFNSYGESFPSATTGVLHIAMNKKL